MNYTQSEEYLFNTMPVGRAIASLAVPTVISGLYGMNVQSDGMPFANTTAGFAIVLGLTLALCVFAAWVLHKKHML